MSRRRFTEQRIAFALKQSELDMPVGEVFRMKGITDTTIYV